MNEVTLTPDDYRRYREAVHEGYFFATQHSTAGARMYVEHCKAHRQPCIIMRPSEYRERHRDIIVGTGHANTTPQQMQALSAALHDYAEVVNLREPDGTRVVWEVTVVDKAATELIPHILHVFGMLPIGPVS